MNEDWKPTQGEAGFCRRWWSRRGTLKPACEHPEARPPPPHSLVVAQTAVVLPGIRSHIQEILQGGFTTEKRWTVWYSSHPWQAHQTASFQTPQNRVDITRVGAPNISTIGHRLTHTHSHSHTHGEERLDPEAGNTHILPSTCAVGCASSLTLSGQVNHPPGKGLTGKRRFTDNCFYSCLNGGRGSPQSATPLPIQQTHSSPRSSYIFSKVAMCTKMSSHRWNGCWWIVKRVTYIIN